MPDAAKADKHIDVLDGVRAAAVGLVVWYHFWQQSWLTPRIYFPSELADYMKFLGITEINPEVFIRYGFQFVDLLILLSAFCNFYPYARAILLQEPWPDTKRFYMKRAVRILPSYYLSLFVMLAVGFMEGDCVINGFFWKDLFAHITCVSSLFPDTYLNTNFNGVLWTVQVEVIYYVLMPWIAKLFRKQPILTCAALWGCGIISANYIVCEKADMIRFYGNHAVTFAGCYANGMLLCMLYITLKGRDLENRYTKLAASLAVFCSVPYLGCMMKQLGGGELQVIQLQQRFELSLVYSCFLLALPFAAKGLQFLFSNRVMKFLASISYNLYLWHQYIAVKCKVYRIPYWEGDTPPNMTGDAAWMWKYHILIVVISLAAAVILTYGFEKRAAKMILNKIERC